MGKQYSAEDVRQELASIEGLSDITLDDVVLLDDRGKNDASDIVSRSRVIENIKLLDAWLGVLRDQAEQAEAEKVVGFFDDESNYNYDDLEEDDAVDLDSLSVEDSDLVDDGVQEVTTTDVLESYLIYDFDTFVVVVADMDDDLALQMAEELAHEQNDLEVSVHPLIKELLRHHPEYMDILEKVEGNDELERKLEASLGGAAGALLRGKTVADLYFRLPTVQQPSQDKNSLALAEDVVVDEVDEVPLGASVFSPEDSEEEDINSTPDLVVELPPAEDDLVVSLEPIENSDDELGEDLVVDLQPPNSLGVVYLPTADEESAEAVLIGIIGSSVAALDYHELFSRFFFETKRSAWPDEFLDYLEEKYAASFV